MKKLAIILSIAAILQSCTYLHREATVQSIWDNPPFEDDFRPLVAPAMEVGNE